MHRLANQTTMLSTESLESFQEMLAAVAMRGTAFERRDARDTNFPAFEHICSATQERPDGGGTRDARRRRSSTWMIVIGG